MWTSELDGGVSVIKIINKYFQFLWTCSPDHGNIVDKSKPQVWLIGGVKESVPFRFTKKQIRVGRSHTRAHSRAVFLKIVFGIKCEVKREVANGFRRDMFISAFLKEKNDKHQFLHYVGC